MYNDKYDIEDFKRKPPDNTGAIWANAIQGATGAIAGGLKDYAKQQTDEEAAALMNALIFGDQSTVPATAPASSTVGAPPVPDFTQANAYTPGLTSYGSAAVQDGTPPGIEQPSQQSASQLGSPATTDKAPAITGKNPLISAAMNEDLSMVPPAIQADPAALSGTTQTAPQSQGMGRFNNPQDMIANINKMTEGKPAVRALMMKQITPLLLSMQERQLNRADKLEDRAFTVEQQNKTAARQEDQFNRTFNRQAEQFKQTHELSEAQLKQARQFHNEAGDEAKNIKIIEFTDDDGNKRYAQAYFDKTGKYHENVYPVGTKPQEMINTFAQFNADQDQRGNVGKEAEDFINSLKKGPQIKYGFTQQEAMAVKPQIDQRNADLEQFGKRIVPVHSGNSYDFVVETIDRPAVPGAPQKPAAPQQQAPQGQISISDIDAELAKRQGK
jgi:hypothetical protein